MKNSDRPSLFSDTISIRHGSSSSPSLACRSSSLSSLPNKEKCRMNKLNPSEATIKYCEYAIQIPTILMAQVALAQFCSNASPGLQERAAGVSWGLLVSEANSIAIG
ncbi:hypothetical protein PIB30_047071 [Stylosanthes scabra]|uniref:Uncharacterized protein n=1 Tax=Stylosanthes scabra TaxID=79078 RepID=A0ABU6VIJ3_9FABA|nr:hypothetical protein [Stylosanthes scabra]